MSEQPEALRLARILRDSAETINGVAFELENMHALIDEMGKALLDVRDYVVFMKGRGHEYQICIDAALAKWKESK